MSENNSHSGFDHQPDDTPYKSVETTRDGSNWSLPSKATPSVSRRTPSKSRHLIADTHPISAGRETPKALVASSEPLESPTNSNSRQTPRDTQSNVAAAGSGASRMPMRPKTSLKPRTSSKRRHRSGDTQNHTAASETPTALLSPSAILESRSYSNRSLKASDTHAASAPSETPKGMLSPNGPMESRTNSVSQQRVDTHVTNGDRGEAISRLKSKVEVPPHSKRRQKKGDTQGLSAAREDSIAWLAPIASMNPPTNSEFRHQNSDTQRSGAERETPNGKLTPIDDVESPTHSVRHLSDDTQWHHADSSDDLQQDADTHCQSEVIAQIREIYRRRVKWLRAEISLGNQCVAICRGAVGLGAADDAEREKQVAAAVKLLGLIEKGKIDLSNVNHLAASISCEPLLKAKAMIQASRLEVDRNIEELVGRLPVAEFTDDVRGLAYLTLGQIIGEATTICPETGRIRCIGDFRTPSALWMRMGLAVIDGERQRRVKGADALKHNYDGERRSVTWNIANNMIRANKKDGDPYRAIYDHEKAKFLARGMSKLHSHRHAARVMTKQMLLKLWKYWRKLDRPKAA